MEELNLKTDQVENEEDRRKKLFIILIMLILFMFFFIIFSSRFFVNKNLKLNVDLDGDGIPDINIDLTGDGKCDINCDIDGDGIPDVNVAYYNGNKAQFNIDLDGDGVPDSNLINQPEAGNKCKVNCDTNGDGIPDENIDLNGNGKCDLNCDKNEEGQCTLNCDSNKDGTCDRYCDTDGDGNCDYFCQDDLPSSSSDRSSSSTVVAPVYIINFDTGNVVDEMDVHPGINIEKNFSITSYNEVNIGYKIMWEDVYNNFVTNNFKYDVIMNDIYIVNGAVAPKNSNVNILESIGVDFVVINNTVHNYKIIFYVEEQNEPQNEDHGKTFQAKIKVTSAQ